MGEWKSTILSDESISDVDNTSEPGYLENLVDRVIERLKDVKANYIPIDMSTYRNLVYAGRCGDEMQKKWNRRRFKK